MKKITIILAILLIASVGFLIKYQSDNEKIKTDNIKLTKKWKRWGHNTTIRKRNCQL